MLYSRSLLVLHILYFVIFIEIPNCSKKRLYQVVSTSCVWETMFLHTLQSVILLIFTMLGGQQIPRVTGKVGLGVQNEAGQRLAEFCQENALVIANNLFQQHKSRLYTWTSPDGQYWNPGDYIICSQRWRSSLQSAKTRLGTNSGWDHELPIAEFRLTLKKVGKTTRPFRYDLNQIPYDYTVEVINSRN